MAEYPDKRGPLLTVVWPGNKNCDDEPLVGIFHSAHDGTAQFEFVGTKLASDESAFPDFLCEFAEALREYQVKTVLEEIEAAEVRMAESSDTTPPSPGPVKS